MGNEARRDSTRPVIIIKKVKKITGGAHGGSWKVAYADFVTAMMAFFLLMWLIAMLSPKTKAKVVDYFTNYSIFVQKGGGSAIIPKEGIPDDNIVNLGHPKVVTDIAAARERSAAFVKENVEENLQQYKDNVIVSMNEGDVRIEVIDKEGDAVFLRGATELNPNGRAIIREIATNLKALGNKIIIEGHTDSLSFSSNRYTNWELSTQRASTARVELENNGFDPNLISMVAGYAATRPLIKENPADPRNRRISVVVQYSEKEKGGE